MQPSSCSTGDVRRSGMNADASLSSSPAKNDSGRDADDDDGATVLPDASQTRKHAVKVEAAATTPTTVESGVVDNGNRNEDSGREEDEGGEDEEDAIVDELDFYCQTPYLYPTFTSAKPSEGLPYATTTTAAAPRRNVSALESPLQSSNEHRKEGGASSPLIRASTAEVPDLMRDHQQEANLKTKLESRRQPPCLDHDDDDGREEHVRDLTSPQDSSGSTRTSCIQNLREVDQFSHNAGKANNTTTPSHLHAVPQAVHQSTSCNRNNNNSNSDVRDRGSNVEGDAAIFTSNATAAPLESPYVPPLMSEFDGELLQIIKNYYMRKRTAAAASISSATASTTAAPPLDPSRAQNRSPRVPPVENKRSGTESPLEQLPAATLSSSNNNTSEENALNARGAPNFKHGSSRHSAPPLSQQQQQQQHLPMYSQSASFAPEYAGSTLDRMGSVRSNHNHNNEGEGGSGVSAQLLFSNDGRTRNPATTMHGNSSHGVYAPSPPPSVFSLYARRNSPALFTSTPTTGNGVEVSTAAAAVTNSTSLFYRHFSLNGNGGVGSPGLPLSTSVGAYGLDARQMEDRSYVSTLTGTPAMMGMPSFSAPSQSAAAADGSRHRSNNVRNNPNTATNTMSNASVTVERGGDGGSGRSGFSGELANGLSALSSLPSYSSTSFVRAYVSDISLNLEPALLVSALTAALNIMVVAFLQHHVLDTRDHLGLFLIGSYMIFASYYMIYYFLERFSGSFRRISSQDKKFYIIGNLIKAGILISITPFACVHLVKIIVFDEWESNILRNLGCIYAIPDFISMIVVRRMRWSTWIHHACVVVFNYFSIMNNYQHENVCRCVVVYAAFSSFAYCVNVLLASRFLGVSANVARVLSFVALVVYALCCAVNWAWQVYYLRHLLASGHDHWTVYVYMLLISLVMWDDVFLNKWLLHHARNNAYVVSQHLQQRRMRQQQQQQSLPSLSPLFTAQARPGIPFRNREERQRPVPPTRLSPRTL